MGTVRGTLRKSRTRPASSPMVKFLKRGLAVSTIVVLLGAIGGTVFMFNSVKAVEPLVDNIEAYLKDYNSKPSIIYSADHKKLYEVYPIYSEAVSVSTLPKHVVRAVLAAEDKRFYEHPGVDYMGLMRVVKKFVSGGDVPGGSTITMQLAKKLFSASERSVQRKVQDISIAIQLEKRYTKDQILELYLNQIYYGEQAYGINAAAEIYYGKKAEDLDLAEAATIARCIRTPSKENPVKNYQLADDNKIHVLETMREEKWITEAEFEEAKEEKPKVKGLGRQKLSKTHSAPYFVAAVKRDLEKMGININEGGYTITTTLDSELQQQSEQAVDREINYGGRSGPNVGAFICMDSQGRILSDVGGRNFSKNQLSYTTQSKLQPGSSFKSFVYSEALKENVIGKESEISNEQFKWGTGRDAYKTRAHGRVGGTASLWEAFTKSMNNPALWTFKNLGIQEGATRITEDFGFASQIKAFPTTALGASEVKMQEMLEAYSTFMLDGKRVKPYRIKEITDPSNELIYQGKTDFVVTRLGPDVCQTMDWLMRGVVTGGTGFNASGCPDAHGKTGTTNDGRSGWFCGYAKGIVGIAWAGREEYNKKRKKWYLQPLDEFGNDVAAPFWASAMTVAQQKYGSDVRPDLNMRPESSSERRRRLRAEREEQNNEEKPIPDDSNNEPIADPDKPVLAPGDGDQNPRQDQDGQPIRDPGSEIPPKPETPSTEPKKPREEKGKKPEKPADNDMTEVEVCADSGMIATRYCPETINKRMSKNKRPKRRCTVHKAPDETGGGN